MQILFIDWVYAWIKVCKYYLLIVFTLELKYVNIIYWLSLGNFIYGTDHMFGGINMAIKYVCLDHISTHRLDAIVYRDISQRVDELIIQISYNYMLFLLDK